MNVGSLRRTHARMPQRSTILSLVESENLTRDESYRKHLPPYPSIMY